VSELYSRDAFRRVEIEGDSAKAGAFVLHELVIPVVQDPDLDPLLSVGIEVRQGDTVVAKITPGTSESDVVVDKDSETLFFHVRQLRIGAYELFTTKGEDAVCIARDIQVKKSGIFFGGARLQSDGAQTPREELAFTESPSSQLDRAQDPPNC
jgi:hypothetical protein